MQLARHHVKGLRVEEDLIAVRAHVVLFIRVLRVRCRRVCLCVRVLVADRGVIHDHRATVLHGEKVRLVATL